MKKIIKVYLTENEYTKIKSIVLSKGSTMSAFVRKLIEKEIQNNILDWDEYHPFPNDPNVVWLIPKERKF